MHIRVHAFDQPGMNLGPLPSESAAAQLIEELRRQACPQVCVGKMPGIETYLHSIADEARWARLRRSWLKSLRGRSGTACSLGFANAVNCQFEALHERRLSGSPPS